MEHNEINDNSTKIDDIYEDRWKSVATCKSVKLHESRRDPRYLTKSANAEDLLPQCNGMRTLVSSAAMLFPQQYLKSVHTGQANN